MEVIGTAMEEFLRRLKTIVSPGYIPDSACISSADVLIEHKFDILGSGPVHYYYGFKTGGTDGVWFDTDDSFDQAFSQALTAAPEEAWFLKAALALRDKYSPGFCPIPWNTDIKTGYRYDMLWHTDVPVAKIPGVDAKTPSESGRCHALLVLAQAYRLTGDRKYRNEAISQLLDWMCCCPPFYGPTWRNGMNVAIRTVNIIVSLALLGLDGADPDDSRLAELCIKSLHDHRRNIAISLEIYRSHNHISAELAGLVLLGALLGESNSSNKDTLECYAWGRYAWNQLSKEISAQIGPDGFDFESSTSYHAYVLEMFLFPALHACRIAGCRKPSDFRTYLIARERLSEGAYKKLREATLTLKCLTQPDGTIPFISDNDAGRYIRWEKPSGPADMRFILCTAAVLFDDPSLLSPSCDDDCMKAASAFFDELPLMKYETTSVKPFCRAFENCGYAVFSADGFHSVLHCSPSLSGHCNNDQLSITLCADGKTFIVDPGTYSYTGNSSLRSKLRSIKAHSTVCVDGLETDNSVVENAFGGNPSAMTCTVSPIAEVGGRTACSMTHDAYMCLPDGLKLRRDVSYVEDVSAKCYTIDDFFLRKQTAPKEGTITERFLLHPNVRCTLHSSREAILEAGDVCITFTSKYGEISIEDALFSPTYGVLQNTRAIVISLARDIESNQIQFRW